MHGEKQGVKHYATTAYSYLLIGLLFLGNACAKDKLAEPPDLSDCDSLSYSGGMKLIIDHSCAYIGCHDGVEAPGNYENYNGILNHLENGSFENRVLNKFDMPPSLPMLSSEQLDSIRCWLETGFLQ